MKTIFLRVITIATIFFISCKKSPESRPLSPLPIVITTSVTAISPYGALSGGTVTDRGTSAVTAKGIVWGPDSLPTIALSTKTSDGVDTGTYTSNLDGLARSKKYYVRAYATNSYGTGYGNQFSFTTPEPTDRLQFDLHKNSAADFLLFQDEVQGHGSPGQYRRIARNNLVLPPGVFMYIRFDSVYQKVGAYNGGVSGIGGLVNTGDTIHFIPGTNNDVFIETEPWYSEMGDGPYDSFCKYSLWISGKALNTDDTYYCKYVKEGGATNTIIINEFVTDTSYHCIYPN